MSRTALRASLALWTRRHQYRLRKLKAARKVGAASKIAHWRRRVDQAQYWIDRRRSQLKPLRAKALTEARKFIGVMEHGGNNAGAEVSRIIRANGGTGPEPWCGDFVAYVYRHAGSKAVTRAWASVSALGWAGGIKRVNTPLPGDLVRFKFDHVGIFEKDNHDGTITTVEGNTGASGAVSDSSTGGDGVYRKVRSKSLVNDYRRVTR